MTLTRRQEDFVQKMIELKQEFNGPVRYSLLAERLGVSPFTAYDMLCLLEEKGYVTSEYLLPTDKCGPGRAERVFYPGEIAQAHEQRMVAEFNGMPLAGEEVKEFVLEKLRLGEIPYDEHELAKQLMARLVPPGEGEVRTCVEVMTVAALRLQAGAGLQALLVNLPLLLPADGEVGRANLGLLGGFIFGILAQQNEPGREWLDKMHEHLQGYLEVVMEMGREDCEQLAEQLAGVFAALGEGR